MKFFVTVIMLVTASAAFATAKSKHTVKRGVASDDQILDVVTRIGERTNHLIVADAYAKLTISIATDAGPVRTKELSRSDFDVIMREYKKLPVVDHIPNECYRSRMDVVLLTNKTVTEQKASCFGISTITEPVYAHFAEILVNAL